MVVDTTDHFAVEWIGAVDLPAVDDINLFVQGGDEEFELGGVVLGITISVEDELFRGTGKTDTQRTSIAEGFAVSHHTELWVAFSE